MIILRINNQLYFSSDIVSHKLIDKAHEQGINDEEFDEALLQFIFHLETCEEAVEVFDDFNVCPVCGAKSSKGVMVHLDPKDFTH
jgi:hypothetical protein